MGIHETIIFLHLKSRPYFVQIQKKSLANPKLKVIN